MPNGLTAVEYSASDLPGIRIRHCPSAKTKRGFWYAMKWSSRGKYFRGGKWFDLTPEQFPSAAQVYLALKMTK